MAKRVELDDKVLESVAGGAIGFDADDHGTYTMKCQFTGNTYYNISLSDVIEIGKKAATLQNNLAGEEELLDWAHDRGII